MSQVPQFFPVCSLSGHTEAINFLNLSSNGLYLLSGGDDCKLVVWNLRKNPPAIEWSAHVPEHGAICSGVWAPLARDGSALCLVFGCADSSIHVYRQASTGEYSLVCKVKGHNAGVEDLTFDLNFNRVASAGGSQLIVWKLNLQGTLVQLAATPPRDAIARSAKFFGSGNSVLVVFLQSCEVVTYSVDPWKMKGSYVLPTRIGCATLGSQQRTLLVSNLATGVDIYDLPPTKPIRVLRHIIRKNVPILLATAFDDKLAIVGSDDGCVRVFDQRTGTLVDALPHGAIGTLVQVVDAFSNSEECVVASAMSDDKESAFEIKIWSTKEPGAQLKTLVHSKLFLQLRRSWGVLLGCIVALAIQYVYLKNFK